MLAVVVLMLCKTSESGEKGGRRAVGSTGALTGEGGGHAPRPPARFVVRLGRFQAGLNFAANIARNALSNVHWARALSISSSSSGSPAPRSSAPNPLSLPSAELKTELPPRPHPALHPLQQQPPLP